MNVRALLAFFARGLKVVCIGELEGDGLIILFSPIMLNVDGD